MADFLSPDACLIAAAILVSAGKERVLSVTEDSSDGAATLKRVTDMTIRLSQALQRRASDRVGTS